MNKNPLRNSENSAYTDMKSFCYDLSFTKDDNSNSSITSKIKEVLCKSEGLFYHYPQETRRNFKNGKVLFAGGLAAVDRKLQDDAADYFLGAASPELGSIAVGADSSRYQRGPCVPLIVTRFGLGAILLADLSVIELVVANEATKVAKEKEESQHQSSGAEKAGKMKENSCSDADKLSDVKESSPQKNMNQDMGGARNGSSLTLKRESGGITSQEASIEGNTPVALPPWQFITDDASLRSSLCTSILFCGYPVSANFDPFNQVSDEILDKIQQIPALRHIWASNKMSFFSMEDLFGYTSKIVSFDGKGNKENVGDYFQLVLFPHCLKLCLMLSGEQSKIVSSQGKSDVYMGRPSHQKLSPLPDPFIPFEEHSEEAISHAYAILRRSRLMRSIRFIVGGGVPFSTLHYFLTGSIMRKQTTGVPVWWCPWIHDLGLLIHAAVYGLVSVVTDLPSRQLLLVKQHIRQVFIEGTHGMKPALPKSYLDHASEEELEEWVEAHSKQFPTPNVIEHRLAFMCSILTVDTFAQYDNVPMFDEGGWPMVEEVTANGFIGDTMRSGSLCLLRDFEG